MDIKDTIKPETELKTEYVDNKIKEKHKKNKKHHQLHHKIKAGGVLADVEKDPIRARYEGKIINRNIKESKPVKVIEKERFDSLKAIFEKKTEISNSNDNKLYKLSLESKLTTFTDKENIKVDANSQIKSVGQASLSEGIQKRIENLFKSNKNNKQDNTFVDHVLENIKLKSFKETNEDDVYSEEEDDEDVVYSENTSFESEYDKLSEGDDNINEYIKENSEVNVEHLNNDKSDINKIPAMDVDENQLIFNSNPI